MGCINWFIVGVLTLVLIACGGNNSKKSATSSSLALESSSNQSLGSSSSSSSVFSGLSQRPSNPGCLAPATRVTNSGTAITWHAAFPLLPNITSAVGLAQIPGEMNNWYVLRQPGVVVRFANNSSVDSYTEVLDIRDRVAMPGGETGLLGIAFHPQFNSHPAVYLYYTGWDSANHLETRVAEFTLNTNGVINRNSERIILRFPQPHTNHNGGQLAFGNDGYLYIASGDGGSGGDPDAYGQNLNTRLGKILRIDVDKTSSGRQYAIPPDNPFTDSTDAPEIWAYGLRNPWRFSFDKANNELWAGDVGQDDWEEINLVTRGGNYGWGDMEGNSCYRERPNCSTANKILPIYALSQGTGACSIIGGYVYRGTQYPAAYGKYFFTDLCVNTLHSITRESDGSYREQSYGAMPITSVSFAEDNQGELYAIGQSGAGTQIQQMQASGGNREPGVMAGALSATGCVDPNNPQQAAEAMIPYTVNNPLWSDGAEKERFLSLPNTKHIELTAEGDFLFPIGSVLMKHFKLDGQYIETRLFARGELGWQGFSYEWLDDQSDAILLEDGKDKLIQDVDWHFPSPGQCMTCHTRAANFSLGLETLQLNSDYYYPTNINANQLDTLFSIGLFSTPLSAELRAQKILPMTESSESVAERARSYLHSNCSHCHRPDGPTSSKMDLRYTTQLSNTDACNAQPNAGDLGIDNARLIAPGEPDRSVLLARMKLRDSHQMPPLGTHLVDDDAVAVITEWIASLTGCN